MREGVGFKFNAIQNLFQKMYWKLVGLLFLIVFAYGLGSAIPREIRKALKSDDAKSSKEGG
jgi:hypothetical protein